MDNLRSLYQPVRFFTLDFVLTWVPLWLLALGVSLGWFSMNLSFMVVASISATVAALVMIYRSGNRALIRDYWDRVFNLRRIRPWGWVVVLLLLPAVNVLAIVISLGFGGGWDQLQLQPSFAAHPLMMTLAILLFGPLPEELGWRGYGIDSLRSRMNLMRASLLLAVIWAVWHVPLFFLPGSYQNELLHYLPGLIAFFVALIPAEIITDWLFYEHRRSTLVAILLHFSINYSGELLQYEPMTKVIQTGLLLVVAAVIVLTHRELFFTRVFQPGIKGVDATRRRSPALQ